MSHKFDIVVANRPIAVHDFLRRIVAARHRLAEFRYERVIRDLS
jgi:hypothetical protein